MKLSTLQSIFVVCAMAFAADRFLGCKSPATQDAAEGAYTASLLDCVNKSSTLAESKACRAAIDVNWGIRDGGAE